MLLAPRSAARLLGVDTGTRLGWAVNAGEAIASGCVKLPVEPRGKRWAEMARLLRGLQTDHGPFDAVYYERSEFIGGKGRQALAVLDRGGFYAVLESWSYAAGVPLIGVGPGQVKKALTGHGKAEKADMIVAAARLCGRAIGDNNEADAVGVLVYGLDAWRLRGLQTA